MDKQRLIQSLSESAEDAVLLAHVWDKLSAGSRRNCPASSGFLTGREQVMVLQMARRGGLEEPAFFGGYPGAERQIAAYVPDYYMPDDYFYSSDSPVCALRVSFSGYDTLSHRDFLGSLMGQGIKRETIGDLLPGGGRCDVVVLREMADYLANQLTQVGRAKVNTRRIELAELQVPEQKVQRITDTVASLRLDSVTASGFRQGRSKAAALISAGKAELNHMTALKPDAPVSEGDVISVRGLGKLRVAEVRGQTKKGRISVVLERFL